MLSHLADEVEDDQLRDADAVLKGGQEVLNDSKAGEYAVRQTLKATMCVLSNALRIADSRGARLAEHSDAEAAGCEVTRMGSGEG